MSQENKYIDPIVLEKLLQSEVSPPPAVWSGIEKALAIKQKAAIVLLYRRVGYAAAILLIGFIGYYFTLSERSIESTENNLSHQIAVDSNAAIKEAVSITKIEGIGEKESEVPKSIRSVQKQTVLLAKTEKNVIGKEEQVLIASQTILEKNTSIHISRHSMESIAEKKPAQAIELRSLCKMSVSPLKSFKANAYKRMIEYGEMFDLLAENTSKSNKQAWSIGLAYAPTSVGRFSGFSTKDYGALYADAANELSSFASVVSEKDLPAYSGGVNIEYQLSERLSFQSGIYYLKQGQRIENFGVVQNDLNASNSSNSYFGNINFDNIEALNESASLNDFVQVSDAISLSYFNADLLQQFNLLEIPLLVSYKIINRKTVLSIISGINPGILVGNSVYLSDDLSNSVGKTESMNTLIYKSVLGVSIEYPLFQNFYFSISPTFKYQLNNFNKNAITDEHLQYFEFKTGLNYRF